MVYQYKTFLTGKQNIVFPAVCQSNDLQRNIMLLEISNDDDDGLVYDIRFNIIRVLSTG